MGASVTDAGKGQIPKKYTNRKRPVISRDQGLFQSHFRNG